ncbi:hypothetical protein CR513_42921, partial [Mucuna pruriens]
MLSYREIEANLNKCDTIIQMKSPQNVKENDECEKAFQDFKLFLASPLVLSRLIDGRDLYLYLVVSEHSINAVIVQEEGKIQNPIYYISRILQGPESRY